jgi:hypothetical protein
MYQVNCENFITRSFATDVSHQTGRYNARSDVVTVECLTILFSWGRHCVTVHSAPDVSKGCSAFIFKDPKFLILGNVGSSLETS